MYILLPEPDQTLHSDLGLHCLHVPFCPMNEMLGIYIISTGYDYDI